MTLMTNFYTHRLLHISVLTRKPLLATDSSQNKDLQLVNMWRIRDCSVVSSKCLHLIPSPKAQESISKWV